MTKCKKYKPQISGGGHHLNPKGDCQNCVYFSKQNCRTHSAHEGGATA